MKSTFWKLLANCLSAGTLQKSYSLNRTATLKVEWEVCPPQKSWAPTSDVTAGNEVLSCSCRMLWIAFGTKVLHVPPEASRRNSPGEAKGRRMERRRRTNGLRRWKGGRVWRSSTCDWWRAENIEGILSIALQEENRRYRAKRLQNFDNNMSLFCVDGWNWGVYLFTKLIHVNLLM